MKILDTYWKFTIMRSPLERLVSGYRDKLLPASKKDTHFFNMKSNILKKYDPDSETLNFKTFIKWIVDATDEGLDRHFRPAYVSKYPCIIQYHYYGNFKHISTDMHKMMDKFHIPRNLYRDSGYYGSGKNTSDYLESYYATLDEDLKWALYEDFSIEFDFYYRLFPEEEDSHMKLLGL